jgi:hypothetical protein
MAGFGPFAAGGGFALDKRALHAIEDDEHAATVRVLGLGALEWALLAPPADTSLLLEPARPCPSFRRCRERSCFPRLKPGHSGAPRVSGGWVQFD